MFGRLSGLTDGLFTGGLLPAGLFTEGFEAEGLDVFLSAVLMSGRLLSEGRSDFILDVVADLEDEEDLEPPRDCASRSNWKAVNARHVSIAANVFADNLITFGFI